LTWRLPRWEPSSRRFRRGAASSTFSRSVIVPDEYAGIDLCEVIESLRPTLLSMRLLIVQGKSREGWITLDLLLDAEPMDAASLPEVCPDSPVRLLVSSGTESEPKLVAYSHNALVGGRGRFLQRISPANTEFRGLYLGKLWRLSVVWRAVLAGRLSGGTAEI